MESQNWSSGGLWPGTMAIRYCKTHAARPHSAAILNLPSTPVQPGPVAHRKSSHRGRPGAANERERRALRPWSTLVAGIPSHLNTTFTRSTVLCMVSLTVYWPAQWPKCTTPYGCTQRHEGLSIILVSHSVATNHALLHHLLRPFLITHAVTGRA